MKLNELTANFDEMSPDEHDSDKHTRSRLSCLKIHLSMRQNA